MLKILKPSPSLAHHFLAMCREYDGTDNRNNLQSIEQVMERIDKEIAGELGSIREGKVRQLIFWFTDDAGDIVGTARLRPELNDELLLHGGNIGYDVRPSCRKRGYGTEILASMLEEARKTGLRRVLVTCDDTNEGSVKIIEKNGGVLENKHYDKEEDLLVRRYWINLS